VEYGFVDSAKALQAFKNDEYLNFTVQLVDASSGEILGIYDNVNFNGVNVLQYKNISYAVNTQGIGSRSVKMRLVVRTNSPTPKFTLTQMYDNKPILEKTIAQQIQYQGNIEIKDYSLSQNYPNPFNPTTTINYQIPKAGHVTLRIFNMLGREITKLVDEEKDAGTYSVEFNAAKLASGIYICQIECNNFKAIRKMTLLK
jgi:hypothetical protein